MMLVVKYQPASFFAKLIKKENRLDRMATTNRIKKIKLNDGSVYSIFDEGALRLNENKIICTGNTVVDEAIIDGHLSITEIDDIPLADITEDILVTDANGQIHKENIRTVLKNIGCITASVENEVLNLFTVSEII